MIAPFSKAATLAGWGVCVYFALEQAIKSPMTRRKWRIYRATHSGAFKCQRRFDEREDDHSSALTDD
jgi:hypothetical protein